MADKKPKEKKELKREQPLEVKKGTSFMDIIKASVKHADKHSAKKKP